MNVFALQVNRSAAAFVAALLLLSPLRANAQRADTLRGDTQRANAPRTETQRLGPNAAARSGEPSAPVVQGSTFGADALGSALASIGTTTRVLMIGAHPDDEDTPLIAWLARGRHVETAYLSLTRGDGGQNLIGNELGELLGMIRTEELLAARRIDGGRQYFTRAYDFGFSKNAAEALDSWPRDTVMGDVIRVVRAFRPHVIIAVFSGTPRDGHGHHQLSGQLALDAFELAGNTERYAAIAYGLPWTVPKFYRARRTQQNDNAVRANVGEYSPLFGRSYSEIASESRSQHKSQGFGALERRGAQWNYLQREGSRVNAPENAGDESSLFDGIDTTWTALSARSADAQTAALLDSADRSFAGARDSYRSATPNAAVAMLASGLSQLHSARDRLGARPPFLYAAQPGFSSRLLSADGILLSSEPARSDYADPALWDAVVLTEARASQALVLAAGVAVEATAARTVLPARQFGKRDAPDTMAVNIAVFNRGSSPLMVSAIGVAQLDSALTPRVLAPDSAFTTTRVASSREYTMPWWRGAGREKAVFVAPIDARDAAERGRQSQLSAFTRLMIGGVPVDITVPVVRRFADPVLGDQSEPVAVVPGITIALEHVVEYARANTAINRTVRVTVMSVYPSAQQVAIELDLPTGLVADSMRRVRTLEPEVPLTVAFTVRGTLPEGMHTLKAQAVHMEQVSSTGYYTISYPHITPQKSYGASTMYLSAVPITVPANIRVGYIAGVSDDGLAALEALDIPVEAVRPDAIATTDLSRYSAIVIGPRAYQVSDALRAAMPRLFAFANAGGTLVVQYGQYEMQEPGLMPFPITLTRPAARVTQEEAPVTMLQEGRSLLGYPNRIGASDWEAWVQERSVYMPSTFDARYRAFLSMNDPDEAPERGALIAAPLGRGVYVYTSLALFRQLPVGVPGAARILVNLVSARAGDLPR